MTRMLNDPRVSTRELSRIRFVYRDQTSYVNGVASWAYTDVDWWEHRTPIDRYGDVPDVGDLIVMPGPGGFQLRSTNGGPMHEYPLPTQVPCRMIEHVWLPDDAETWTLVVLLGAANEDQRGGGVIHCPPVRSAGQDWRGRGSLISGDWAA